MPAITADTLTLPRISAPTGGHSRPVISVTTAPSGHEGEGFPVRRAFAGVSREILDPFIHMDQMGEVNYAPYEPRGTDWHPHRGFETVTYIMDGIFVHQDSHGILHIETPPEKLVIAGGLFHGVQLWVNLPSHKKMISPAYQNLEADLVTLISSPDGGALIRLIAGDLGEFHGPGSTHTPIVVSHVTLAAGARVELPWNPAFNALAYVLAGSGSVSDERRPLRLGQLAVYGSGDSISLQADDDSSLDVLLLGGQPISEPVVAYGPFVMNTENEIRQAFDDYQQGRLGTIPVGGIRPYRG
jgi:redox-sensitive bicupin YhaK (pirin superfamily)